MDEGFEGWVRVLCLGALAGAAYLVWQIPDLVAASICAVLAAVFALWPERVAYAYRGGAGVPRWTKPLSVTHVDTVDAGGESDTFASYIPQLHHLSSAYSSIVGYLMLLFFKDGGKLRLTAAGVLVAVGILLFILGRSEEQRRAREGTGPGSPPFPSL